MPCGRWGVLHRSKGSKKGRRVAAPFLEPIAFLKQGRADPLGFARTAPAQRKASSGGYPGQPGKLTARYATVGRRASERLVARYSRMVRSRRSAQLRAS